MLVNLGKGRFILNTAEDTFARAAMEAYADAANLYNPDLAENIRQRLSISFGSFVCIETALRIVAHAHSIGRMQDGYSKQAWEQVHMTLASLAS